MKATLKLGGQGFISFCCRIFLHFSHFRSPHPAVSPPLPLASLYLRPAPLKYLKVWEWSVSIFLFNSAPDLNAGRLSAQRKRPFSRIHRGHISLNVFVTEEQTSALSSFLEAGCVRGRSSGVGFGSRAGGRMLRRWTDCQRALETPSSAIKQPLRMVDSKRLQWDSSVKHTFVWHNIV